MTFVVIFAIFAVALYPSGFLNPNNLLNILRQTATISVMAVAMTFVLAAAEIDLSVGAVAGLASVVTAMSIARYGIVAGVVAGLTTGLLVGLINGFLATRIGIPSFLVTLGMQGIATGTAMWVTQTAPIPIANQMYTYIFGSGNVGPIPTLFIWTLAVFLTGHLCLKATPFGRQVLATGGNETAARYSGINTKKIKYITFVVMSMIAALAGMLYAGRLHSGRFQWGQGDELSVIAAVVLGGTSLFGGKGSVIGTIIGAILIGLINNGLILMGLEASQQMIVRGAIIIFAVALTGRKAQS
ncbi:MAG: ABC transporter permease [Anaerolineae bacterium]|nr:ABC transporter permease [Anaerolineae bacterium]